jgi:hypothetical protein
MSDSSTKETSLQESLLISIGVIQSFVEKLSVLSVNELRFSLINLFRQSLREINQFYEKRDDLNQTSLNVRNIFELYIISLHIYSDKEALKSWYGQVHKDLSEINSAFKTLLVKQGLDTSEIDKIQDLLDSTLEASQYTSKGGFNLKTCATKYGYEIDYDFVYKLSSKLIHPTSFKVNYYATIEHDTYISMLTYIGVYFAKKSEALSIRLSAEIFD